MSKNIEKIESTLCNLIEEKVSGFSVSAAHFFSPKVAHKSPVIIIGSPLAQKRDYASLINEISKDLPVIYVELPMERSIVVSSYEDMAKILNQYLDVIGIRTCSLVAHGFESFIALELTKLIPERIKKIQIGSVSSCVRESVKLSLIEALNKFDEKDYDAFSSMLFLNLFNFSQREYVSKGEELIEKYLMKVKTEDKFIDYLEGQVSRLIGYQFNQSMIEHDTLIVSGEFDRMVTPFENFQFKKRARNSQLVIVSHCDFFVCEQMNEVYSRLSKRFLTEKPLGRMKYVELFEREEFPDNKIRMEKRVVMNDVGFLDNGNGVFVPINIVDINKFGCKIFTTFKEHHTIESSKKLVLHIPDEELDIELFLFKQSDEGHYRGVFNHSNIEYTKQFSYFIDGLSIEPEELPKVS